MTRKLKVYLYQDLVGGLIQDDSGQISFVYAEEWLENPNAISLSHSLPLRREKFKRKECQGFFSGILPEDEKRKIIAGILGISSQNDFAMLERIGGECAGAITFLPDDGELQKADYKYHSLSETDFAEILRILPTRPLLTGDQGVRLSLAGAQDKLVVLLKDGVYSIPLGNAPSTHIVKPAIDRFRGLVYNEAVCMHLANAVGIPAANTSVHTVCDINYLLIERYDRTVDDNNNILRIHQEDFCQALGIVPEMKYQNEGGPSLKRCFDLVRTISSAPVVDLRKLLDLVIFNFLIGNNDAHGKNFSILYKNGSVSFAPVYDVVCTSYYPELSRQMAMKIGGEYLADKIMLRHFELLAKEIGFAVPMVIGRVAGLAEKMLGAIDKLDDGIPVFHDVAKIISDRCLRVKKLI